ncbi:hypothetical protein CCACVL1_10410 [Corchorus capsularis]|uniref:Uncharacterized protein n=1 Tax=Corchorus capsularis TaxID=210143 RepID=A0A1R3IRC1_COCAP|nr:hypothetical protein CCACVL1_10410 [Corchorus capsularis]
MLLLPGRPPCCGCQLLLPPPKLKGSDPNPNLTQ